MKRGGYAMALAALSLVCALILRSTHSRVMRGTELLLVTSLPVPQSPPLSSHESPPWPSSAVVRPSRAPTHQLSPLPLQILPSCPPAPFPT